MSIRSIIAERRRKGGGPLDSRSVKKLGRIERLVFKEIRLSTADWPGRTLGKGFGVRFTGVHVSEVIRSMDDEELE
jgi:hypothetical protein